MTATCPTCRARFRETAVCSRCGSDLAPLMRLQVHAWRLREQARQSLRDGDFAGAHRRALEARALHRTPRGDLLLHVTAKLVPRPSP